MFFLLSLLDDTRIRISLMYPDAERIREAQKDMDTMDPDPQHWAKHNENCQGRILQTWKITEKKWKMSKDRKQGVLLPWSATI